MYSGVVSVIVVKEKQGASPDIDVDADSACRACPPAGSMVGKALYEGMLLNLAFAPFFISRLQVWGRVKGSHLIGLGFPPHWLLTVIVCVCATIFMLGCVDAYSLQH